MTEMSSPDKETYSWIRSDNANDRRIGLDDALAIHVNSESSVYLATDTLAAVRALVRRFWQTGARLTVICPRAGASHAGDMLFAGIVKKLIAASFGSQFPSFRPSPLIQRAYRERTVEFECWSLFSLVQRLMAGALGVPFFPTRSLKGSTLIEGNSNYAEISDPFTGQKLSVVSALNPDVTIVRVLASDKIGNSIATPPFEDDLWSTRAAKNGVIVLAENIVSSDFIRRHAQSVRIPADLVLAVCHTPYASHPDGFESGLRLGLQIESYVRDIESYTQYDNATKDPEEFREWLKHWVFGVGSHEAYLKQLRSVPKANPLPTAEASTQCENAYSNIRTIEACQPTYQDWMIVACARIVIEIVASRKLKSLLVGVGQSEVAGGLAFHLLKKRGIYISLVEGTGTVGYEAIPVPNAKQLTATMLTGTLDTYGTVVGGHSKRCLALLGAGEIDILGNINSTRSNGRFLVGSGGANDAVSLAAETVIMMRMDPRRMLPIVEYITCPGSNIRYVATDRGVFRKAADGRFQLWRYFAYDGVLTAADAITAAQRVCTWEIEAAADIEAMPPPSIEELSLVRWLSPQD